MHDLDPDERTTLDLVASNDEHAVVYAVALKTLRDKGLVRTQGRGWGVTPLGRRVVRMLARPRRA